MDDRLPKRIADKIHPEPNTGCWLWVGSTDRRGYGQTWWVDKLKKSHRTVYEILVGPIPDGLSLDHKCFTPGCCNPDHLEPVTHRENMTRSYLAGRNTPPGVRINSGKTHCPYGHPYDKVQHHPNGKTTRGCMECQRRIRYRSWHRKRYGVEAADGR